MTDSKKAIVALAAAGGFAFVLVAGAGAWFMVTQGASGMTGDITAAAGGDYEPSSEWIEEGLDPNVTTFGFGGGEGGSAPSGPEMSEQELQNLVYAKQASLMQCYADSLAENPDLQGRVDMHFGIAPDGHVAMVKVTGSSLESKGTEDCLVSTARAWSFPRTNRDTLMKFDTDFTFVYE